MKKVSTFTIVLITAVTLLATQSKKVEKSFTVEAGKRIEINGVSGMDIKMESWDKNEVQFKLHVRVKSSDDDYEKAYIEDFEIDAWETSSDLVIDINETSEESGWSLFDIFKLKFGNSVSKEIKGTIYVPNENPLETNIRYSDISLNGMNAELNLLGRGNKIDLVRCGNVRRVQNNYGDTIIRDSKGELILETRSSNLSISEFEGEVEIDAYYTKISVSDVTSNLEISSRSTEIVVSNVGGDLEIKSDYSNMNITDVAGKVEIHDRSGEVDIVNVGGLTFEGPYTKLRAAKITGRAGKEVKISNRSGLINLSDVTGNVTIDDQYSNMKLERITGNVELSSRSSTIFADRIGGNWQSSTQYCTIEILRIDGTNIFVKNRSNPVKIEMNNVPKSVDVECTYGGVDLSFPKGFNGYVTLEATYGEIDSDLPLTYQTSGSSVKANGQVGVGSGKINISTRSGNIALSSR